MVWMYSYLPYRSFNLTATKKKVRPFAQPSGLVCEIYCQLAFPAGVGLQGSLILHVH